MQVPVSERELDHLYGLRVSRQLDGEQPKFRLARDPSAPTRPGSIPGREEQITDGAVYDPESSAFATFWRVMP
jgi:hypothetical protein